MAIVRWNPWQVVPSTMFSDDDWFRQLEDTTPMDVYETDNEVVVKLKLPGYTPKDVDITLIGDTLTVKGEEKQEIEDNKNDKKWHRREIKTESFSRSVTLPMPVKSDKADAKFKNGILTLTLPKAEEAKPKTIQIKAEEEK